MPIRFLTIAYIDVFRAVPILIMILMISGGVPFLTFLPKEHPDPRSGSASPIPSGTASPALVIVYGAYMAEVYRAGIEAVPRGQMEAARSLGMSHFQAMRHVVVPQAVTKIPAPMLNELISLLKDTTLVSVIALGEAVLVGREILAEQLQQLGADARPRSSSSIIILPAGPPGRQPDHAQPGQNHPRRPHRGRLAWPSRWSA